MKSVLKREKFSLSLLISSCLLFKSSSAVKLGLLSSDLTKLTNPLHICKLSHHSPVFNINKKSPLTLPPPRLPAKPPLLPKLPLLPPSLLPPLLPPILPPLIPGLPLITHLTLLPPVLPPPLLPIVPKLGFPKLSPGLPGSLGRKLALKKALGSGLKPIKVPIKTSLGRQEWKPDALDKLRELRRSGSLTTAEFLRFKKLLLRL